MSRDTEARPSRDLGHRPARNLEEFLYHKVGEDTQRKMSAVRMQFCALATYLESNLPDCRAKSICFTELETASMRAIQSLALTHGTVIELETPNG